MIVFDNLIGFDEMIVFDNLIGFDKMIVFDNLIGFDEMIVFDNLIGFDEMIVFDNLIGFDKMIVFDNLIGFDKMIVFDNLIGFVIFVLSLMEYNKKVTKGSMKFRLKRQISRNVHRIDITSEIEAILLFCRKFRYLSLNILKHFHA